MSLDERNDPLFEAARTASDEPLPPRLAARLHSVPRDARSAHAAWIRPLAWSASGLVAAALCVYAGASWRGGHRLGPARAPSDTLALDLVLRTIASSGTGENLGLGVSVPSDSKGVVRPAFDPLPTLCGATGCCVHSASVVRRERGARLRRFDYGCSSTRKLVLLILPAEVEVSFGSARTRRDEVQNAPACIAELSGATAVGVRHGSEWWLLMGQAAPEEMLRWMRSGLPSRVPLPSHPPPPDPCEARLERSSVDA